MVWIILTIQALTMSYTPHYNQGKDENERLGLSFSFSESQPATVTDLMSTVRSSLQRILSQRFSHYEKRTVDEKHNRLNFACPYCGDSHADSRKKRGNIYYGKSIYFKCYNCGKYRSVDSFLKDFAHELNSGELVLAREMEKRESSSAISMDPLVLLDQERLKGVAIERTVIEELHNLVPVTDQKISVYLKKRLQRDLSIFSWNEEKQQLYIFNMVPETTRVLGYQIRNFKSQPKYLTFRLSKIYESLGLEFTPDMHEIDQISTIFGLLRINISQPITVLEGPLDSFLCNNSVATCSTNVDVPIQFSTLRYLYDYDDAGKKAALSKSDDGMPVFLWKRLFTDLGITETVKKMDLTDLTIYCIRKGIQFPTLNNYFSKDKYDVYYL